MELTAFNVEKAVRQFYSESCGIQSELHQWLTAAQVSPQAWVFAWELLQGHKDFEVQFFAAGALYVKVLRFWHEVPADQYGVLKKKLLECVVAYSGGPKVVLTRLCTALSVYILHTIPEHWANAVGEIIDIFLSQQSTQVPHQRTLLVLLEILTVIPEEGQRGVVRNELQRSLPQVMGLLMQVLGNQGEPGDGQGSGDVEGKGGASSEAIQRATHCVSAWVQFGIPLPDTEGLALQLLRVVQTRECACEAALEALTHLVTQPDSHKFPASLLRLLHHILQLQPFLQCALAQGVLDVATSLYALYLAFAESHSRLLLESVLEESQNKENVLRLIQIILQCSSTPGYYPSEESCSVLAFGFWYILQDDIITSDSEKYRSYISLMSSVYRMLVDVMLKKSQYPPADADWSSDDRETFRCYRQDVADTMTYSYSILKEDMLAFLLQRLEEAVSTCLEDNRRWQPLEACIHAFHSLAESIGTEEMIYLPKFMATLPTIPYNNNLQVITSTLDTIGAYAEWINCHPEVLPHMVPLLVLGLANPDMAPAATMALKDLTRDCCQTSMRPFAQQILTASQQALSGGTLKSNECVRLMYPVGKVLSMLPHKDIMEYLNHMLMPHIRDGLLNLARQEPSPTVKAGILIRLKMVAMLFTTLDTKPRDDYALEDSEVQSQKQQVQEGNAEVQPVFLVLTEIMTVLQYLGQTWHNDGNVVEALCSIFKQSIATLLDDCGPLVPTMLSLLVKMYQQYPHPAIIDLAKQFMVMFGRDNSYFLILASLLLELCNTTLHLCNTNMAEHTDILAAFFQMLSGLMKKNPNLLAKVNVDSLFQCAICALGLNETPTVKAASSFLVHFITNISETPEFATVVSREGEALVLQTLRCIGGESPRGLIDHIADVLLALNKKHCENLSFWLKKSLAVEGFPSPRIGNQQKDHFASLVLRERANKRKLQDTVREFTLLCRGLVGSEYAGQSSLYL